MKFITSFLILIISYGGTSYSYAPKKAQEPPKLLPVTGQFFDNGNFVFSTDGVIIFLTFKSGSYSALMYSASLKLYGQESGTYDLNQNKITFNATSEKPACGYTPYRWNITYNSISGSSAMFKYTKDEFIIGEKTVLTEAQIRSAIVSRGFVLGCP